MLYFNCSSKFWQSKNSLSFLVFDLILFTLLYLFACCNKYCPNTNFIFFLFCSVLSFQNFLSTSRPAMKTMLAHQKMWVLEWFQSMSLKSNSSDHGRARLQGQYLWCCKKLIAWLISKYSSNISNSKSIFLDWFRDYIVNII